MRNNRLLTATRREIFSSKKRFFSLSIMSLLGVGTFAGIKATSPNMIKSLDTYFDQQSVYDLKLTSLQAFDDDTITTLSTISSIQDVEGSKHADVIGANGQNEAVIRMISLPEKLNNVTLLSGSLPTDDNQVAVESRYLDDNNLTIGDNITLTDSNDYFITDNLTIVGTVKSPLYIGTAIGTSGRGNTNVGAGTINYYAYMDNDAFNFSYYTDLYLSVTGASDLVTSKTAYVNKIDQAKTNIKEVATTASLARLNRIKTDKNNEINQQETTLIDSLNATKANLDSTKEQLDNVAISLSSTKSQLDDSRSSLDIQETNFATALASANVTSDGIETAINSTENEIATKQDYLATLDPSSTEYTATENEINELQGQLTTLNQLKNTRDQLAEAENAYSLAYSQYQSAETTYNENLNQYNEALTTYNDAKASGEATIAAARATVDALTPAVWNINDRSDDSTYSDFISAAQSIDNLSRVFPTVFFVVAVLVSLISMSRMVEDDRTEIGTLKSLGFSNHSIMVKYTIYSGAATIIGGLIGAALGFFILPRIVWNIYQILFSVPKMVISYNLLYSFSGIIISFVCIVGAALYSVSRSIKEKPAQLMRPKAPKPGKRIFLEHIPFIWKHLSFSRKITARNLFRYKKRVFATVVGIMGCSALMLSGFGLRDGIIDIASTNFGKIFTYNQVVYVNNINDTEMSSLFNLEEITSYVPTDVITGAVDNYEVNLFVPEDDPASIVNLIDVSNKKTVEIIPNEIIITEKLADLAHISAGDTIDVSDDQGTIASLKVSAIVENYVNHLVYMDKSTFETNFQAYNTNVVYLRTPELSDTEQNALATQLLENSSAVMSVSSVSNLISSVDDILQSLNSVVMILIILSAALSFVVMFNLTNINISERKREIATLKVLGFSDHEVDNYITRELIILTIIGIIFGLVFGYFLTHIIISTVEVERILFLRHIKLLSYIYSGGITLVFAFIVILIAHRILQRINMIDSLKSVE